MPELEKENKEVNVTDELGRASLENHQHLREHFDRLASILIKSISPEQLEDILNEIRGNNENPV